MHDYEGEDAGGVTSGEGGWRDGGVKTNSVGWRGRQGEEATHVNSR